MVSNHPDLDFMSSDQFVFRGGLPRPWQLEWQHIYENLVIAHQSGQHRATLYAGVGAGKTIAAGFAASFLLHSGRIDKVFYICPNRRIRGQVATVWRERFGIELVQVNRKWNTSFLQKPLPVRYQGIIATYNSMALYPVLYQCQCMHHKYMVIFDEVHHLGDHPDLHWAEQAMVAFSGVPYVLCLTGTPYASKEAPIEFVSYAKTPDGRHWKFQANPETGTGFTYSLGRAIAEGVCRTPTFMWFTGTIEIEMDLADGTTSTRTVSFDDKLPERLSAVRLRKAVQYGSAARYQMLEKALKEAKMAKEKVAIFLGGDSGADKSAIEDAKTLLPSELQSLGYTEDDYSIFTSDRDDSYKEMDEFEKSSKWIAISVDMMSEGSDMPSISRCIFLTNVTAWQKTLQRIGRGLRQRGEPFADPMRICTIHGFPDPEFVALSEEMHRDRDIEEKLHKERTKSPPTTGQGSSIKARCVGGGEIDSVSIGDVRLSRQEYEWGFAWCESHGLPPGIAQIACAVIRQKEVGSGNGSTR